jgi:hypothetical protein
MWNVGSTFAWHPYTLHCVGSTFAWQPYTLHYVGSTFAWHPYTLHCVGSTFAWHPYAESGSSSGISVLSSAVTHNQFVTVIAWTLTDALNIPGIHICYRETTRFNVFKPVQIFSCSNNSHCLCSPGIYRRFHRNPTLKPIVKPFNPIHYLLRHFSKNIFYIIFHLYTGLIWYFLFEVLYCRQGVDSVSSSEHKKALGSAHLKHINIIVIICLIYLHILTNSSLCNDLNCPFNLSYLGTSLPILFSNTQFLCFKVNGRVWHPCKTTDKLIILHVMILHILEKEIEW